MAATALLEWIPYSLQLKWLPDGLLPRWLLLVGTVAVGNSIQAYQTMAFTQRLYCGAPLPAPARRADAAPTPKPDPYALAARTSPATPLSARTFGTWTLLAALIRIYAAHDVSNGGVYGLAFASYAVALAHFTLEWWVYGTTRWTVALAGPVLVSSGSLVWMWLVWDQYVKY